MIKKISDKDKEDWKNFLTNTKKISKKILNKKEDIRNEKKLDIPDKDKEDWERFLKNNEKIPNKDFVNKKDIRHEKIKKIDLHGYTI